MRGAEGQAPEGGYGSRGRNPVLIYQRAELQNHLGTERWEHDETLPRQPRVERVADQSVPEMGGQDAQRPPQVFQTHVCPKGGPPSLERTVSVDHALG